MIGLHIRPLIAAAPNRIALCGLLVLSLVLGGCASGRQKSGTPGGSQFAALYAGKSELAYATRFPAASAAEAIASGVAAEAGGDYDRALFEYIRALEKSGEDAHVLTRIGDIHAARNNLPLAEFAYRWAIKVDQHHAEALTGLGILQTKQRHYAAARAHLQAALAQSDQLAAAHNALGILEDLQGQYDSAQEHYRAALALVPRSALLYNNLGYSRYLSGDHRGAITAFKKALDANRNYRLAWRNLALVYTQQQRYDEALAALAKVQSLPKAYNDVGYLAMLAGRLNDAEAFFAEALEREPKYYELAQLNIERVRRLKKTRP
jgi:Flp pilus assembly protein TadD